MPVDGVPPLLGGPRPSGSAPPRCAIALVTESGTLTAEGTCEGTIGTTPRGDGGFGYDPLFWPVDYPGRTMAEISLSDKNTISHRARAFAHLPALLEKGLA